MINRLIKSSHLRNLLCKKYNHLFLTTFYHNYSQLIHEKNIDNINNTTNEKIKKMKLYLSVKRILEEE